jgi:hypothetical protein
MSQATETPKFTATMIVDENGNCAVGTDREDAWQHYTDEIGWDDAEPVALRWVELQVAVPLPVALVLTGEAPAELAGQAATLAVA